WLTWGGFLRLDSAYNIARPAPAPGAPDYRGLNKLRLALQLELGLKLGRDWDVFVSGQAFHDAAYALKGREDYTPATLKRYESEAELREGFLRGTLTSWMDIKLGRQIAVWGKADAIRVVDVLNPVDFREPGLTDLEDIRIPLSMSRLDFYLGNWSLGAVAVHEVRFDKQPAFGSEFYPLPIPLPREEIPAGGGANTEYGVSLAGLFSGWDMAFYWAQVFNDEARFDAGKLVHDRLTMRGLGFSASADSWLFKGELARFDGLRFFGFPGEEFAQVKGVLGVEYAGFRDTTLSLEAGGRHLKDYREVMAGPPWNLAETVVQYVAFYNGSFLREKLKLIGQWNYFGHSAEQGSLHRYGLTYELAPALNLGGGLVLYQAGNGENALLAGVQDNDRLYMDLKWSF
ncbi:MAG: hypothetical protein OEZ59_14030, partial [Deltaproteobacteria bacterium]|nr:hypothetical protein [Deltaproteobacteria bacterium]